MSVRTHYNEPMMIDDAVVDMHAGQYGTRRVRFLLLTCIIEVAATAIVLFALCAIRFHEALHVEAKQDLSNSTNSNPSMHDDPTYSF